MNEDNAPSFVPTSVQIPISVDLSEAERQLTEFQSKMADALKFKGEIDDNRSTNEVGRIELNIPSSSTGVPRSEIVASLREASRQPSPDMIEIKSMLAKVTQLLEQMLAVAQQQTVGGR
jgi:hypothetical protein